jgi:hypothetical protein
MVEIMKKINLSNLIGILLGLSLILVGSVAADTSNSTDALISPETIGTGIVKENIQKFTGSSDEVITYQGMKEYTRGKVYEVTTKTGRFLVNIKTGEIESAIIQNGLPASSLTATDAAGMMGQAEAFAQKNYRNFTGKKMVLTESRVLDHGDAGKEYLFVWNEIVGEAFTPSEVMVSLFPDWGNSIAYIGIDRPLLIDTTPEISREAAQETALRVFTMGSAAKAESKLVVITDGDNQKLVWVTETFERDKDNLGHGGIVIVDADTGDVLSVNPI